MKLLRLLALVGFACGLGWYFLPAAVKQGVASRMQPPSLELPASPSAMGAPGLRKCLRAGEVTYTNAACPPGSQEQAMAAGSLSILPAAPVPAPRGGPGAAPVGNARDLLLKPEGQAEADIKAKRIDAIVHQ